MGVGVAEDNPVAFGDQPLVGGLSFRDPCAELLCGWWLELEGDARVVYVWRVDLGASSSVLSRRGSDLKPYVDHAPIVRDLSTIGTAASR